MFVGGYGIYGTANAYASTVNKRMNLLVIGLLPEHRFHAILARVR